MIKWLRKFWLRRRIESRGFCTVHGIPKTMGYKDGGYGCLECLRQEQDQDRATTEKLLAIWKDNYQ